MNNSKVKSSVVAGLLGIFLGQFGVHDWYLGKKKQGIAHVCLFVAGMILIIIAMAIIFFSASTVYLYSSYSIRTINEPFVAILLMFIALAVMMGNGIWALIESIILFAQGDAGLAAKGYVVAPVYAVTPANAPAPANTATPANPASPTPAVASATVSTATAPTAEVASATSSHPSAPTQTSAAPVPHPQQPMNPATKKKIILGCIIGAVVLVAMFIIGIVVAIVSHVDYGEAYRQAKDLKEDISELYTAYDCERVVNNVDSDWTSDSNYNKYIESCKKATEGLDDKIAKLEKTAGVRKNSDLKTAFDKFKKEYVSALPNAADLNEKFELYKTWHSYVVAIDDLSASDTDAKIQSAANILINSGNDALKTYGEGWLEKTMDYVRAYRAYQNSSYSDSNRPTLRDEMYAKQSAQRTWVSENKPDITEIAPLDFANTAKMYSTYRDFYNLLVKVYEENYNSDSGDCSEFHGIVNCS